MMKQILKKVLKYCAGQQQLHMHECVFNSVCGSWSRRLDSRAVLSSHALKEDFTPTGQGR